jgi:hypothetical protein
MFKKNIHKLFLFLFLFGSGALVAQQGKETTTGNKKLFDKIIRKMENNLEKNYFTDSLQPVQYSEYTFMDSSKQLLNAVYIEGIMRPVWFADYQRYQGKQGLDLKAPMRYWRAEFYEETPGERYGSILFEEAFGYTPFVLEMQNSLAQHISANAQRRREKLNRINKDINPLGNPSYTIDNSISSPGDSWEDFQVVDTIYENQLCYKLIRTYQWLTIYGDKEAERFAQRHPNDDEQTRVLRRLIHLWANAAYSGRVERIIGKEDYALLYLHAERFIENAAGKFLTDRYEDKFIKKGKHYKQIFYKACNRRFVAGTLFVNEQDIYTYRIKQPLYNAPSIESAQTYKNKIVRPPVGYEDFCIRLDTPNEDMLKEWKKFIWQ